MLIACACAATEGASTAPWTAEAAADEFLQAHTAETGPLALYRKNRYAGVYRKVTQSWRLQTWSFSVVYFVHPFASDGYTAELDLHTNTSAA